jgi:hypothetical protein
MTKRDLIDELNDEYRSLLELVQDFGKEDFEKPGAAGIWTARDVFAHLAFWNGEAKQAVALALGGERPVPWLDANVEESNTRECAARAAVPLYKVMEDFRRSQRDIIAQLDAASDGQLNRVLEFKTLDGTSANAGWVIADLILHLRGHAEAMDIWLHSTA